MDRCRSFVESFLKTNTSFASDTVQSIILALDEAVANVIRHGKPTGKDSSILLKLTKTNDSFIAEIQDHCSYYNPLGLIPSSKEEKKELLETTLKKNAEEGKSSGLGVAIYINVMDELSHKFVKSSGNFLTLTRYLN